MDGGKQGKHTERWEPLGQNLRVLTGGGHGFTTDTLLLAHFSQPRPGERCADLGTGCGTIPLLWCRRARPGPVLALEVQREAAELARRSAEANGLGQRITVVQGDVRDYKRWLPHQGLELAACNPPYFPVGAGLRAEDPRRDTARREGEMSLQDLARAAQYALKCGGRLCLCLPVGRMAEAMGTLAGHRLEPKRLQLVQARRDKAPYLFLLECRSGGRSGLQALPTLVVQGEDGQPTGEMLDIYGDYTWSQREEGAV